MTLDSKLKESTKRVFLRFAWLGLTLLILNVASAPESRAIRSESVQQDRHTGCEYNTAVLDGLAQKTKLDELIIVLAYQGRSETRSNLNHRRLSNVRVFFTEYLTDPTVRRKPQMIVLAQGEQTEGLGRVEFYVGGKLVDTLKLSPNADLSVGSCGWEPPEDPCPPLMRNLYPCKDKYSRKP